MFSGILFNPGSSITIEDISYDIIEQLAQYDSIYYYKVQISHSKTTSKFFLLKIMMNNDHYYRECAILQKLKEFRFILIPIVKEHSQLHNAFVYEYPSFFTLGNFIRTRRIKEETLCLIITKILIALHNIHKEQIFHLNIDQNSIFVDQKEKILLGGFQGAVCLSDKNYSKRRDLLENSQILPPELKKNLDNPIYKASADIFILGTMIKKILQMINPNEDFEYCSNEIDQFALIDSYIGYYWKHICRRATEKNPLLRADAIEILGILSQSDMKIPKTIKQNFGLELNIYFIEDFSEICKSLIYENSDLLDFPFLHRIILSLRLNQSLLSELSLILKESEFKTKPFVILKIQTFLFYFYTSGDPYLFDSLSRSSKSWSSYLSFLDSLSVACHSPQLTSVNLHRELMIQMLHVLFFKEELHTQTESLGDWSLFKHLKKSTNFSYLKRLNELFDLLICSLKTVPILSSALMFLCIDEIGKSLEFFEQTLEFNNNSNLRNEFEGCKKKSQQHFKTFKDLHQSRLQTNQNPFLFGSCIPEEFKKLQRSYQSSRSSLMLANNRESPELWDFSIPKDLEQGNQISSRPEHSIFQGTFETQQVVIKVFIASHPLSSSLFENELKIMNKLNHKNIIKLLLYDETEPQKLVYKYCKGGTLHDLIHNSSNAKFSLHQKLDVAVKIAEAVQAVHSQGIIHRGLTSENVLLADKFKKKSLVKIKLAGFGMAVFADSGLQGIRSGNLYYRPPEMLTGEMVGFSADVYSFAFLLFEIFSGSVPFAGEQEIHQKVVVDMYRPQLNGLGNEIDIVNNIIQTCWQQDPQARPDFNWVIKELRRI